MVLLFNDVIPFLRRQRRTRSLDNDISQELLRPSGPTQPLPGRSGPGLLTCVRPARSERQRCEAFPSGNTVRLNPERVSQQSLGSIRSSAPQGRNVPPPNPERVPHANDRSPKPLWNPVGVHEILLCFPWGSPYSRRPQALL